jgi:hypothetical protein
MSYRDVSTAIGRLEVGRIGSPRSQRKESGDYPGRMSGVGSWRLAAENQVMELIFADGTAEFRKGKKRDQHYEDHDPD